jgi:lysine-N-methylase
VRPRLAEHALARRHFIDGAEVVVVHDTRSGDLVRMPPRAWALVEAADGTRDLGGLLLAASQKGELRRPSEVVAVLSDLHAAGLLTDGIDPFALAAPPAVCDAAAPLDVLPFSLVCDGSGSCCALYSTVRFSEGEAERARSLLPAAADGRARRFLPLSGSGAQPACAVTMIDGRCAYLAGDGACELHRRHGEAAKPSGCAIYPATFVFDGEAVRVSLGVECACVAKSIGRGDGAPLVAGGAAVRGDLPAGAIVAALPEALPITSGATAPRAEVVRWSRAVLREGPAGDAAALLWALAAKVGEGDLSDEGVRSAVETSRAAAGAPSQENAQIQALAQEIAPWIEALAERAAAKRESAEKWRSEHDRVRVASRLLAEAAASLRDPGVLARAVEGSAARDVEALYVTAILHGHALLGELPLSLALRDRAARILLARAVPDAAARTGCDDPGAAHPLPLVEAMMRAQGLKEYARKMA